MQVTNSFSVGY